MHWSKWSPCIVGIRAWILFWNKWSPCRKKTMQFFRPQRRLNRGVVSYLYPSINVELERNMRCDQFGFISRVQCIHRFIHVYSFEIIHQSSCGLYSETHIGTVKEKWKGVYINICIILRILYKILYIRFGIILTQFYINFSRHEHQIEVLFIYRSTPEILRFHPIPPFIFPLQSLSEDDCKSQINAQLT